MVVRSVLHCAAQCGVLIKNHCNIDLRAHRFTQDSGSITCGSDTVKVSLAVISRTRISVALTTREGTRSGRAIPQCACDSGPILISFR
ncbi:hypothetical protein IG631_21808 [Alternaria alternata]|nr:hypothetical protein IG631_21808 [Alternaria alternata]